MFSVPSIRRISGSSHEQESTLHTWEARRARARRKCAENSAETVDLAYKLEMRGTQCTKFSALPSLSKALSRLLGSWIALHNSVIVMNSCQLRLGWEQLGLGYAADICAMKISEFEQLHLVVLRALSIIARAFYPASPLSFAHFFGQFGFCYVQ